MTRSRRSATATNFAVRRTKNPAPDLSLQKIDSGNASAADKAAYDAAKKDLDDKFKKDKDDRKAAYDKALGELKDQVSRVVSDVDLQVGRRLLRQSLWVARSPTCWASSASTITRRVDRTQ